jgi:uncharacterized protein (TIGR02391 family)
VLIGGSELAQPPAMIDILGTPDELLALEPEDLAAVLLEIAPSISQSAGFAAQDVMARLYPSAPSMPGYPHNSRTAVELAVAEALSWLETSGLIVRNPSQPHGVWFLQTRRASRLRGRADLAAYRVAQTLPKELLRPDIEERVRSLFTRGDYDTAVFQAFKMVEMFVRKAAELPLDLQAQQVMRTAFHPAGKGGPGPLTDTNLPGSEQQGMSDLFTGAMGHAKNPPSHRDVKIFAKDAARLILFASYLLDLAEWRALLG